MVLLGTIAFVAALACGGPQDQVHHFVFFGGDRDKIRSDSAFARVRVIRGAQLIYPWRMLEPEKDEYDFSEIRSDLAFLAGRGKKLWIQLQDVTFSDERINVPRYLLNDPVYSGGVARQYRNRTGADSLPVPGGWVARRWDPHVQARLHKLYAALGKEFDGQIEGINLAETSLVFRGDQQVLPAGFSFERYRDAVIENMKALKRAFPRSVAMQYANFMPGEWRPTDDRGLLKSVYDAAVQAGVAVGGPDLMPHRRGQLGSSYPLIREACGKVRTGIAVQDGNLGETNPRSGRKVQASELLAFAMDELKVNYIFWGTEEPHYSAEVIPLLRTR